MQETCANTGMVKKLNSQLICLAFKNELLATKGQVARVTGLSVPTVNKIVDELVVSGELLDTGEDVSHGGRNAKLYRFNADFYFNLCMYFENTYLKYEVINALSETVEQGEFSIAECHHLDVIDSLIEQTFKTYYSLKTIMAGVPAGVNDGKLFFIPGFPHLQDFNLKEYLETKYQISVYIENDVNAAAVGYSTDQDGSLSDCDIAALYIGANGLGSGIVVNGEVLQGFSGFCGEISFIRVHGISMQDLVMENRATAADFALTICAICSVINPKQVIFFSSHYLLPDIRDIADELNRLIPSGAMPHLEISDQWDACYFKGLKYLSQNN